MSAADKIIAGLTEAADVASGDDQPHRVTIRRVPVVGVAEADVWKPESNRDPTDAEIAAMSLEELRTWAPMWLSGLRYWERIAMQTADRLNAASPPAANPVYPNG